jgi:hypothetical protein
MTQILAARQVLYNPRTHAREYVSEPETEEGLAELQHALASGRAILQRGLGGCPPYDAILITRDWGVYHVQTQEPERDYDLAEAPVVKQALVSGVPEATMPEWFSGIPPNGVGVPVGAALEALYRDIQEIKRWGFEQRQWLERLEARLKALEER